MLARRRRQGWGARARAARAVGPDNREQHVPHMGILTYISHKLARFSERVGDWWQHGAMARPARRQAQAQQAAEAERLDRIRNPFKYLGKP